MGEAREAQEGGDVCIVKADSHCCMAETNTTLEGNYPPIKKKKKNYAAPSSSFPGVLPSGLPWLGLSLWWSPEGRRHLLKQELQYPCCGSVLSPSLEETL